MSVWTAALLTIGLVGLSRLYLGAHWLTDVLAGIALGAAWLFALLTITRTVRGLHRASVADHQESLPPEPTSRPEPGPHRPEPAKPTRHPSSG